MYKTGASVWTNRFVLHKFLSLSRSRSRSRPLSSTDISLTSVSVISIVGLIYWEDFCLALYNDTSNKAFFLDFNTHINMHSASSYETWYPSYTMSNRWTNNYTGRGVSRREKEETKDSIYVYVYIYICMYAVDVLFCTRSFFSFIHTFI